MRHTFSGRMTDATINHKLIAGQGTEAVWVGCYSTIFGINN
jgi:hypothetical protein